MAEQVLVLNITDVPPPNFKDLSQDAQDKFLKEHGLPSKPTLSLYDCYQQAAKMTHVFRAIGLFVKYISGKVVSGNAAKLAKRMIESFNTGICKMAQNIGADCKYLMENGKYNEESTPMEPADFRKFDFTMSDNVRRPWQWFSNTDKDRIFGTLSQKSFKCFLTLVKVSTRSTPFSRCRTPTFCAVSLMPGRVL